MAFLSLSLGITYVEGSKLPCCEQTYAPKEWWATEALCTTTTHEKMKPVNINHRGELGSGSAGPS